MKKIIRTTKELPSEFDLDRYKNIDRLNPFEWLRLIQNRQFFFTFTCYALESNNTNRLNAIKNDILKWFEEPFKIYDPTGGFNYEDDIEKCIAHNKKEMTVIDMSLQDFFIMQNEYDKANCFFEIDGNSGSLELNNINFMDYCNEYYKKTYNISEAFGSDILNQIYRGYYYPVMINPYSNKDQLVNDILVYVENLREKLNINPDKYIKVDNQTLQKWASYNLLALMDLQIWAKVNNFKITNTVLCVSAFPTGVYGESNLAKSIQPIINDFFDFDGNSKFEIALSRFVAHEIWKDTDKYFPENIFNNSEWKEFANKFVERWLPKKD